MQTAKKLFQCQTSLLAMGSFRKKFASVNSIFVGSSNELNPYEFSLAFESGVTYIGTDEQN